MFWAPFSLVGDGGQYASPGCGPTKTRARLSRSEHVGLSGIGEQAMSMALGLFNGAVDELVVTSEQHKLAALPTSCSSCGYGVRCKIDNGGIGGTKVSTDITLERR